MGSAEPGVGRKIIIGDFVLVPQRVLLYACFMRHADGLFEIKIPFQ
jgi:hypothetical protein